VSSLTALLDANVLYPAPMRDLLLQLAVSEVFRAKWTAEIQQEWFEALLRKKPSPDRSALERTRDLMNRAVAGCMVTAYESLIPTLELPDPNDRHVLAAAIAGQCDVIVTQNGKDFPGAYLASFGIKAQHPDHFFLNLLRLTPEAFCSAAKKVRTRLKRPSRETEEYLGILESQGLKATVAELRPLASRL
jgi:predicted nucleic acid-binding protein